MKKKVLRVFAMTIIKSFLACIMAFPEFLYASGTEAQNIGDVLISIKLENSSVENTLKSIEQKTDFTFWYDETAVSSITDRITFSATNKSVLFILDRISEMADISFRQINNKIAVKVNQDGSAQIRTNENSSVQQVVIHGSVTDDQGLPLPGASVVVKGTTRGTTTDSNGQYTVSVHSSDEILQFSFIGFISKEIKIGIRTIINVQLLPDNSELEGVVVVGYGTQQKSDITGSVASISQRRLDLVPNRNIAQVLQGALPGIVVQQTSAGAEGEQTILVRGRNSILASNDPLIVVDGIPYYGNLNDINVNDVKSLEVLKDASASAIYGSRGSNGVILVTTKTGSGGKARISYQGKFGTQNFINLPDFLNGEEFYEYKATRDASLLTDTEIKNHEAGKSTDWIDLSLRRGSSQSHNMSVSGGSDAATYYVGGDYLDVKGLSVTDKYQRFSGRVNLDVKITKWLDFGTRSQFTYDDKGGYDIDYDAVFKMNPLLADPYDENGEVNLYPWPEYPDANPLEARNYEDKDYSSQMVSNNFLKIDIPFIDGLSYRINTGIRRRWTDHKIYGGSSNTSLGIANSGYARLSNSEYKNNVIENILSYKKDFHKHSLFITGVYSYEVNKKYAEELTGVNFPNDELSYYAISQASSLEASNDYERTALISQMLRVNYSFNNKYLLTFTGRRDGFSGFGPNDKWGIFPSVALGWNISKEPWFLSSSAVNQLKIRLSWGINGNQAVDPYASITRMKDRNTLSGDTSLPGYVPSVIGNENLGWESSKTINSGVDFGFYNNRIRGSLDLYKTRTSDLLLNRAISSVHGINEVVQNIGETQTKGIELALSVIPVSTKDLNWTLSGNLAASKNKIVSLYGELDENGQEINDLANSWFIGEPIRVNYDYKMIGVWQLDEAAEAEAWGSEPGDIKIEDVNKDDHLDDRDRQIIGQLDPKFTWGLSNSVAYKNFNLEFFLQGSHGATKPNNLLRDNTAAEIRRNVMKKDWWTETNPTNKYFKNDTGASSMDGVGAKIYEKAGFIRLKDVSLAYNFPAEILSKLNLEKLQLFVTGRNLMTITDWTGGDPELESSSEAGVLPLQREFILGISVGL